MHSITEDPIIIVLLSIFVILIISFIVIFVIYYQRKQETNSLNIKVMQQDFAQQLLQSQIETQEETFTKLEKELHDNVAQLLSSAKLLIGVTQRKLINAPDTLAIADETLATAINELRSLSKALNKEWLQQFNFIENLETEIKRINASDSLKIHLNNPGNLPLKSDQQIILFRIVQEALQNAIKHARASNITINIKEEKNELFMLIEDDGRGFIKNENKPSGVGLSNMQHRTKLLGGSIQWNSSTKGTSINIQLPVKSTAE